jgi:DNA-binding MarR family transcriptional regulator
MPEKDWTDALLEQLAVTRPKTEIQAYQVTARISRIGLHIARAQDEAFGRLGLNRGDVGVLGALLLAGNGRQLSPTQLFKGLMLSSAGTTNRLDRLERRGYVKRTRHPRDRRSVLVALTAAGRQALDQAISNDADSEAAILSSLNQQDRRLLTGLLKKLLAGIEPVAEDVIPE